jgi:integrase
MVLEFPEQLNHIRPIIRDRAFGDFDLQFTLTQFIFVQALEGTVRNVLISDVLKPLANRFPRVGEEPAFEDGRVQSFRHYFCSVCANSSKVPELMLMTWLGHRNSDMVKHYYHGNRDLASQTMNQINFLGEDDAA